MMEIYILEALAIFQYLSAQQLLRLLPLNGIASVNRYLRALKNDEASLIKQLNFGALPGKGSLASVYFLTQRGSDFLRKKLGYQSQQIKRPLGRSSFYVTDYAHRMATIDFKIKFYKWLARKGYKLNFFDCYFERDGGNNSHSGNTSKSRAVLTIGDVQIIPDAVVGYTTPQGAELFVFEQHMGKDVKRALRQIQAHCRALSRGAVNEKYGSSVGYKVVYIFDDKRCMQGVVESFSREEGFGNFYGHFHFLDHGGITALFQAWKKKVCS